MHEILVSEEEANHCVRRGNYYAIRSMLPEITGGAAEGKNALSKELSSGDNVLDLAGTRALLAKHKLMPEDVPAGEAAELLR